MRKGSAPESTSTSRFAPPVSEVEYEEAAEGVVPANTKKNNDWGGGGGGGGGGGEVFRCWVEERNKQAADPVPDCLLACSDAATVSKCLRYFVLEARTCYAVERL